MAMTYTAQMVVELIQELEPVDPIRGMQLLNEAHLYITSQLHLVPDQTVTVSMVAGQQEYTLPDAVVSIWDAAYWSGGVVSGGTRHKPLKATNVDTLFEDRGPNWQLEPASTPWCYYERGGMIGFVPAPNNSVDQAVLYYTPATTLLLSSTLPTNIPSAYAWVYHACGRACVAANAAKQPTYQGLFENEMHRLREYVLGRTGRDRARVSFRVPRVRRA